MTYEILTIRCRTDNYAFLIANTATGDAILFDAPESAPINAALAARKDLTLTHVLITHHHGDHVEGLDGLANRTSLHVIGSGKDAHRLPHLDSEVDPGSRLKIAGLEINVMGADGHTINHIAFYVPQVSALFTGDSLMTHGCGRLFEGTPSQMFDTITAFAKLPDDTRVYSGHDYAGANLAFAKGFAPDPRALSARQSDLDKLQDNEQSTTGVTLALEKQINPYLRVHLPAVKASVGMTGASDLEVFTEIRKRKDNF